MNNFLLFIAALLVLALSALFAAPLFVNWNDYRDVFERQASRLVGRQVNVGGDVSLTFLPAPVLRFENINVADAQGGFDAPFMSARSLTVWLSVPPLLRGVVEARDAALDQPILNLEVGPEGRGNWADIGHPEISLPFMPREVALDSVRIIDASVTLARESRAPYLTLDRLNGELSARSLRGPWKFSGDFEAGGERAQMRLSTGRRGDDGGIRMKAVLVNDGGRASYAIDGDLSGFDDAPRFAGDFEARFLDADGEVPPADAQSDADAMGQEAAPPVLIKARVEAGPGQAKFSEIEAAIRRSDKPQTVTGEVNLHYAGELDASGKLASRWLDIDSLSGGEAGGTEPETPMAAVTRTAGRLLGAAAALRSMSLDFTVEQAVLAGDLLHEVSGKVAGRRGRIGIERFSARLPGDSRLSLKGELVARSGAPALRGSADIAGEKVNRLLGWAGLETGPALAAREGDFSLKGMLDAAPGAVAIDQAEGHLFGSRFSGALRYSAGERRLFELTFKSDRLDIGRIGGSWIDRLTIPALLRGGEEDGEKTPDAAAEPGWFENARAQFDIDIGAVTLPGLGEHALAAGVDIEGGDVNVRKLSLVSDGGLRLQASGKLSGLDETPSGSIDLTADADTIQGVKTLARLLELDGVAGAPEWRLRALTPAALTGSVRSAGEGRRGLAAEAKGKLGGNDLAISASLEGKLAEWKGGAVELGGRLKAGSARSLLAQLSSGVREQDLELFSDDAGLLEFSASGVPSRGMKAALDFSGGGIALAANGALTARDDDFDFSGRAKLDAGNGAALLTLAGANLSPGHEGERVNLEAGLSSAGKVYEITDISGSAGGISVAGGGKLDLEGERPRAELELETGAASLPFLFEPLIGWNGSGASAPGVVRGVTRSETFWPEDSIDTELLGSFDGALKLKSKTLRLGGPLSLSGASLDAKLENGVLEIARIEGGFLGGAAAGQAEFRAEPGGLTFKAGAGARGLDLDRVAGGEGLAKGRMDVEIEIEGQGLSPRGIASALDGKGRLTFAEGKIARLEPGAPRKVAAGLAGDGPSARDRLMASIRRELAKGSFAYRPFETGFQVRNGVARAEEVRLRGASGSALVTTFLEFATLRLDSEWLLVAGQADDEDAPRITLTFAGPLADLGVLTPDIDAGALRRNATIRRMERDVELLEKLEVPGAPKRESGREETPAVAAPAQSAPRAAAIPETPAPAPARRPAPPAPERERPSPAPPVVTAPPPGDSVVSRPLPPAAPPPSASEREEPAPRPAQPPREQEQPLPWLGRHSAPRDTAQPPASASEPAPPPPPPSPPPQRERERERWNPFDGL